MYKVKGIQIESQQTSQYTSDIESELTKMLSEELAKQIDKEILTSLGLKERNTKRIDKINKIFSQT
jgi:hypothetical protein